MSVVGESPVSAARRRATSASCEDSPAARNSSQLTTPGPSALPSSSTIVRRPAGREPSGARRRERLRAVDHRHHRLRVLGDVVALLGRVVGVDAGDARADRHAGQVGDEPLGPVRGEHDDPASGLDAVRHQRARRPRHGLLVAAPADGLPARPALAQHRRPLARALHRRVEHLEDGLRACRSEPTLGAPARSVKRAPPYTPSIPSGGCP